MESKAKGKVGVEPKAKGKVNLEDRCPTGVKGLDELLNGGFPRGRTILLAGECGTGKTIFGIQYLCNGITEHNEPGVLLMLEQNVKQLKKDMRAFKYDLDDLEKKGKLVIIDASLSRFNLGGISVSKSKEGSDFPPVTRDSVETRGIVDIVRVIGKEIGAKRILVDSLPALNSMVKKEGDVRKILLSMNYRLQSGGFTTLIIDDIFEDKKPGSSTQGYVVDGVIVLQYNTTGPDTGRYLTIQKMRGTRHSENIHPMKFVDGVGIEIVGVE